MPASRVGVATRAFVAVLIALARSYELALQVNRDSSAEQLLKAYRKLLLKTHPDKGGLKVDQQKLQAAKENWDRARKASPGRAGGRPSAPAAAGTLASQSGRQGSKRKDYRVPPSRVLVAGRFKLKRSK